MDWEKIHADFPVNENLIWLNNCGTTPVSKPVLNTVKKWLEAYSNYGSLANAPGYGYEQVKSSIYRRLEMLLHAQPGELVLTHNTAEGMNFLSHGFVLSPGQEILILENEYPSNVYPWEHWRSKGVQLRTIPLGGNGEAFLRAFKAKISAKTKVVALSSVHWCTGFPLPLEAVGQICHQHGIAFVVDGSQGVGMLDIEVHQQNITGMAFSAWKWLLGPLGVGVLFIAKSKLESIRPIFRGTESVINDQQYLPYRDTLKPTAERFLVSTGNINDWIYFDASLAYLDSIGFLKVRERILELSLFLKRGLENLGFQLDERDKDSITGIVAASKPGLNSAQAVRDLKSKKIIVAERLDKIRFSPHIYNSLAQLEHVLSVLAKM